MHSYVFVIMIVRYVKKKSAKIEKFGEKFGAKFGAKFGEKLKN